MKPYLTHIVAAACTLGLAGNQSLLAQDAGADSQPAWKSSFGADLSTGYDLWHGFPDGGWPQNSGVHFGANLGALVVPNLGLGVQLGGSYGIYDLNGRSSAPQTGNQEQTFFTGGFFYRGPENSPVSAGIVYDLMINHNYGVHAVDASLQQLRAQIGVKVYGQNEVGVWGAMELNRASIIPNNVGVASYRGIDQGSLYYQYTFEQGAKLRGWIGLPFSDTMAPNNNGVGTWLAGARFDVPLNDRLGIYGEGAYMSPHASRGFPSYINEVSSISIGLTINLGFGKPGGRSSAYLPVANNSTFFVDGSSTSF